MHSLRTIILSLAVAVLKGSTPCDAFSLVSSAWDDGETIPTEYLADGDNISPPLEFTVRQLVVARAVIVLEYARIVAGRPEGNKNLRAHRRRRYSSKGRRRPLDCV